MINYIYVKLGDVITNSCPTFNADELMVWMSNYIQLKTMHVIIFTCQMFMFSSPQTGQAQYVALWYTDMAVVVVLFIDIQLL